MHRMQIVLYIRVCIRIRRHVMTTTTTRRMFVVYVHAFCLLRSHATVCLRIHIFVANSRSTTAAAAGTTAAAAAGTTDAAAGTTAAGPTAASAEGGRRIPAASLPTSRRSVPHCYSSRLSLHYSSRLVAHSRLHSPFANCG